MTFRTAAAALALAALLGACANIGSPIGAYNGVVALKSPYSAPETMKRLEAQLQQHGLVVVAKLDHAAAAARAGRTLRPTEVLLFNSPQAATPLIECVQTAAIDMPLKALVWVDVQQQVWLGYDDPAWLVQRHTATRCPAAASVAETLAAIAQAAVAP